MRTSDARLAKEIAKHRKFMADYKRLGMGCFYSSDLDPLLDLRDARVALRLWDEWLALVDQGADQKDIDAKLVSAATLTGKCIRTPPKKLV